MDIVLCLKIILWDRSRSRWSKMGSVSLQLL